MLYAVMMSLIVPVSIGFQLSDSNSTDVCWKDSYGRGVGKPIHACKDGLEKSGALCYPQCKNASPTYYGVGPVCWQHCRDGYIDEGALCRKDGSIITYAKDSYGRGAGIPLQCADDEDEDAALCYPKCKAGYYGVGPVCWISCYGKDSTDGTNFMRKISMQRSSSPLVF